MNPKAPLQLRAEVRGEQVDVRILGSQCAQCGRVALSGKSRRAYHRAASDAYRRVHNLLTAEQIDRLRRDLNMTWKQFAEYVGIGIATLKRWMGGEIQTPSMDRLVRLSADLNSVQRAADELAGRLATAQAGNVPVRPNAARWSTRIEATVEWLPVDHDLALCA